MPPFKAFWLYWIEALNLHFLPRFLIVYACLPVCLSVFSDCLSLYLVVSLSHSLTHSHSLKQPSLSANLTSKLLEILLQDLTQRPADRFGWPLATLLTHACFFFVESDEKEFSSEVVVTFNCIICPQGNERQREAGGKNINYSDYCLSIQSMT